MAIDIIDQCIFLVAISENRAYETRAWAIIAHAQVILHTAAAQTAARDHIDSSLKTSPITIIGTHMCGDCVLLYVKEIIKKWLF